jgi:hypothetical protein
MRFEMRPPPRDQADCLPFGTSLRRYYLRDIHMMKNVIEIFDSFEQADAAERRGGNNCAGRIRDGKRRIGNRSIDPQPHKETP